MKDFIKGSDVNVMALVNALIWGFLFAVLAGFDNVPIIYTGFGTLIGSCLTMFIFLKLRFRYEKMGNRRKEIGS